MSWFRKAKEVLDPLMGKTVIHFTTHGCMATEHEFNCIGTIIGTEYLGTNKLYRVKVLKNKYGQEARNYTEPLPEFMVPSWYLQSLGADFYIAYD